ncbi:MAG: hypothetical protein D6791_01210 [Chloroflexi bacterium]|nr:MAG: hypothetical protein D6791_01210 [Chloroflexota bacterium]
MSIRAILYTLSLIPFLIACAAAPAAAPGPLSPQSQEATLSTPTSLPSPQNEPRVQAQPEAQELVSVIVRLDFEPLATYSGGIEGLSATNPAVTGTRLDVEAPASQAYLDYINGRIDAFAEVLAQNIPSARIVHRYTVTLGGVSVILPRDAIPTLEQLPGVRSVTLDEAVSPADVPPPAAPDR